MRQYFRTCCVHSCYSVELNEPQPKKCKCRLMITKESAEKLVSEGSAEWLIKYPEGTPTYNVVLCGRAGKTPRAQTIEKAHMERYAEHLYDTPDIASPEVMQLFEIYHDIEMESRIKLFGNKEILTMKKVSDTYGMLEGESGRVLHEKLIAVSDTLKAADAKDDPFSGHAIFNSLGGDQRTCGGVGIDIPVGQERLDKN